MTNNSTVQDDMLMRLSALESEKKVSQCMTLYMRLCDQLGVDSDLNDLGRLFSEDAVWQGKGKRYAKTFGRYEGREAITDMFANYTKAPAHFELNTHFLCNEVIHVDSQSQFAKGTWMMIQPSSFNSGKSQLSCAYISAEFVLLDGVWLINVFTTENIFSRPMADSWNNSAALIVPTKES